MRHPTAVLFGLSTAHLDSRHRAGLQSTTSYRCNFSTTVEASSKQLILSVSDCQISFPEHPEPTYKRQNIQQEIIMATLLQCLRPTARLFLRSRASRPMATASRHVSLSGYIVPRSASTNSPGDNGGKDIEVGELQGASFKIEPLRRVGEDPATMRARLLCTPSFRMPILHVPMANVSKTNPANAEPSNQTSSSPPSPTRTSPP